MTGGPYNGYHGNPKPSFLGVITVITHILMAHNLHGFHGHLGSKGPYYWVDKFIIPLLYEYIYIMGVLDPPPNKLVKEMKAGILLNNGLLVFRGVFLPVRCVVFTSSENFQRLGGPIAVFG